MSGPTLQELIAAGYKPEQILTCPRDPCLCRNGPPPKAEDCGLGRAADSASAPPT